MLDVIPTAKTTTTGLTADQYTSAEVYERELDRFWRRTWLFVCHNSEIPEKGDYRRFGLDRDNVIVIRGEDGKIRGFHNVCRHRGSPLVGAESGRCERRLVCPYHGWSFGLDGSLRATPKMHEGFERDGLGLKPVHTEIWNGFVFINLSRETPEPIAKRLGRADFGNLEMDKVKVVWSKEYVIEANWKLAWENGLECYHCGLNHPTLCKFVPIDDYGDQLNAREACEFDYIPDRPMLPGVERKRGGLSILKDGQELSGFTVLQWHLSVFELFAGRDGAGAAAFYPVSPTKTAIRSLQLVHKDAIEGKDYTATDLDLGAVTREEDNVLCELVQKGVRSPAYEPGPFNERLEAGNRVFVHVYNEQMRAP